MHPKPAAARQDRGEQLRRARATAQLLRAVFPSVAQLRIDLRFDDAGASPPAEQAHLLYPPAPAFFTYRCPYADCDGEFALESAVRRAVAQRDHRETGSLQCAGMRPSEPGVKSPCGLRLAYAITALLGKSS